MNKSYTTLLTIVVATLAMPASAQECVPQTETPELDTAMIPGGSPDGNRYYVDNDVCQFDPAPPGCGFSIWIYMESNGLGGLQRNDGFSGDRACGNGDTIIL